MRKIKQRIIVLCMVSMVITCFTTISNAASTSSEQKFRELYLHLLESGDNSVQDISDLELPYMICYNIMEEVKWNEGFVPYQCYKEYNLIKVDKMETKEDIPYLMQFHLSQDDSEFEQRYAKVKQMIAKVQENLDEKMTDLDKLLWFHEYVVEQIYYKDTDATAEHLGGATLAQGYGVCEVYANALTLFLKAENIPCEIIAGGSHEWVAVKIDGQWYHVDPTWDDTIAGSVGTHYFLMRNDDEFLNTLTKKHEKWVTSSTFATETTKVASTATDYTDWYVHKVWNRMYYYNGYWYYVMDHAVRKNNIQGTKESVICEGKNLKLNGMENGVLTITCDGQEKQIDLKEESVPTATPFVEVLPTETPVVTDKVEITATPAVTPKPETKDVVNGAEKPEKPVIQSITNKKGKKIKIVLKKKVSNVKGYEVVYSTNKNFKKSVKKAAFTGRSKTISKLSKNKKYYIKVRAYKKDAKGEKIYGSYSKVWKIKITK